MLLRLLLPILMAPCLAWSHAPVIANDQTELTAGNPYEITEVEHSKAIFATLEGSAHYYRLDAEEPFDFYVGITQAKLDSCDLYQTFSFDVLNDDLEVIDSRDGTDFEWWPWFEEYGESWYWVGPEIGKDFKSTTVYPAGTYYVRVFNEDNSGRYVLAVGDQERFGFVTIASMIVNRTMKKIEDGWWDEGLCPADS